jgi:LCP family protein required for cell wall assembly
MTDIPYSKMGGRQRGGGRYAHPRPTGQPAPPRANDQRPYRAARFRQSGRGYVESRLNESRPITQPAHAVAMGGYQPTMRVDFSASFPPSSRTLGDEIALLGQRGTKGTAQSGSEKPSLMRRYLRHKRLVAVTGVFAVVMLVFGIYVAPVLIAAARAYQDVFVDNSNRENAPAIAIVNAEQTPVAASQAGSVPTPTPPPEWTGSEPLTMLLLGVDKRPDDDGGSRSDTMILVRIDPATQSASILSIPRDTKVIVPGFGVQKVNAAYAFGEANSDEVQGGGPGLTMRTIEANFGIHVDYYAEVDFAGFEKIIDTVGGVTIDNPYAIKDDEYPADGNNYMRVYFPPGWQHLDGEDALIYARTRHDDGDSMRSVRQQQLLLALREQAMNLDLISNATELLGELRDSVRTDLSPSQALELARLGTRIDEANIHQVSLMPALEEDYSYDAEGNSIYYLVPNWNDVAAVLSDFAGTTIAPPGSALADPTLNVPIVVRNASGMNGMASQVVSALEAQGFTNVSVDETATGEAVDVTQIVDRSDNLSTSMYLAGIIGVPIESVLEEGVDDDAIALQYDDWRQQGMISVTIGTDAPDPSTYSASADLEDAFGSYGLDAETAQAEHQVAAAITPTALPPIEYALPATGNPSTAGAENTGDLSGGPDVSLAAEPPQASGTPETGG